jgi:SagB-type dehydrogenase family enzyme
VSVFNYHDRTKHSFRRFARSLGYLDWASQPDPFRRYRGAPILSLPRTPLASEVPYYRLYEPPSTLPAPVTVDTIGEFLRCSLGLSAWKQAGESRWALRVNPSSGNLHPTEGYVVTGPGALTPHPAVFHYAPREHVLEERAELGGEMDGQRWAGTFLVALTSIHWREAWKYGERAYRYCQHDAGHALGALRAAAAMLGWRMTLLPRWSDADLATLLGLEQSSADDAEVEAADCLVAVGGPDLLHWLDADPSLLVRAAHAVGWQGAPNRLSGEHVAWPLIEEVSRSARFPGLADVDRTGTAVRVRPVLALPGPESAGVLPAAPSARVIILGRRSAVAFDGSGRLSLASFSQMLGRLRPPSPPWDVPWWDPQVHLVLFVHRVDGLLPGIYAFTRETGADRSLRSGCRPDFLWEPVQEVDGLFLLAPLDCRSLARRLSCDQDIAADGFFGAAMVARFDESIRARGDWFYRNLFWECGMIGQVLYLEAEAAGARATGIGCYYDDPVHELLGLGDRAWQSLYHFSMGTPIDDSRLTTSPGYDWDEPDAT